MRFAPGAVALACVAFLAVGCGASSSAHAPADPGATKGGEETRLVAAEAIALSADGIAFETGSRELQGRSGPALDALASAIERGDGVALVTVRLDPDPGACAGEPLARQRAEAIRDALVARGVPAGRVEAEGVSGRPPGCGPVLASRATVTVELVSP